MLLPMSASAQQMEDPMTLWQARRIVMAGNSAWTNGGASDAIDRGSFRFTLDNFEFDASGARGQKLHFNVDLRQLEAVSIKCRAPWQNNLSWCFLTNEAGKSLGNRGTGVNSDKRIAWWIYNYSWIDRGLKEDHCSAGCASAARLFAAAINRLRVSANDPGYPLRSFKQQAAAWRALAIKPPLAEGARIRRLAAEDAIKNQKPNDALNYYELGVEADPMWAQGWFNAAVIAGHIGYYADAAEHMQNYLELMPDAADAQSARDQIDLWRYKAGREPGK